MKLFPVLYLAICLWSGNGLSATLGSSFTYQGQLLDGGFPANGAYDLQFTLFDAATGGSVMGTPLVKEDVGVTSGLFTVSLDYGAGIFGSNALWLAIGVRPGASTGSFATLPGRQALTPTPMTQYALLAGSVIDGSITSEKIAPRSITTDKLQDFAVNVDKIAPNAVLNGHLQNNTILSGKIASGQVVKSLNGLRDDVSLTVGTNLLLSGGGNSLLLNLAPSLILRPDFALPLTIGVTNPSSTFPGLRIDHFGNASQGALNVVGYGSGLLASFDTPGGRKVGIDTNGTMTVAGDVVSRNTPFAKGSHFFWQTGGSTEVGQCEIRTVSELIIDIPANGVLVVMGNVGFTGVAKAGDGCCGDVDCSSPSSRASTMGGRVGLTLEEWEAAGIPHANPFRVSTSGREFQPDSFTDWNIMRLQVSYIIAVQPGRYVFKTSVNNRSGLGLKEKNLMGIYLPMGSVDQ